MNYQAQSQLKDHGYCLVDLDDIKNASRELKSSNLTIIALCSEGSIDYEFNMENVHADAGMRICYLHVVQTRMLHCTPDCKMRALVLDNAYMFDCTVGVETNQISCVFDSPVAEIPESYEMEVLHSMFDLLDNMLQLPVAISTRQVTRNVVRSIVLMLCNMEANNARSSVKRATYTMADTYFRLFITLVAEHVKTEHEVSFYAEQLHITPKYLSEICKQKTQRKAKEIISGILLRQLKGDLLTSGKSMKIIADEYGFADQSSLGKFFRKMTGLSPLHFKQYQSGSRKKRADDETTE
ncbi:MAG: AraC family transcriptional regulator [Muribaculaceae bacterium]|nr:AraC family transcriptional regulator [Muribaculaceae bacterium]